MLPFGRAEPSIHETAFIAPSSVIVGDVEIGKKASIWYGTVIRGDVNEVRIGDESNI